ncbi:protein of unknown function (plasmid) [Paraburkholderia dioscoreae]|uniref:Uncharacterized protein n=1 Tax=Paraburkholderia dioscoreae TaxID=2604047 RepID=A0A5Q4ZI09_9BURK|nr:protein of unknown function [Paraburkholderia dioscoreae]
MRVAARQNAARRAPSREASDSAAKRHFSAVKRAQGRSTRARTCLRRANARRLSKAFQLIGCEAGLKKLPYSSNIISGTSSDSLIDRGET